MAPADARTPTLARLSAANLDDFFRLHSDDCGADWCRCVAWWVPEWDGWGDRSAQENRALRDRLSAEGHHDGYLLYDDGEPVGWCQAGPRDRLAKLVRQFDLPPDPDAWAITCFLIRPDRRRQGLATRLLAMLLADLVMRGVRRVEAFPKRGGGDVLDLWNGAEPMFLRAGFRVIRDDPQRPILSKALHG